MSLFSHPHAARPTGLLLACLLSVGLAACGGEDSGTLLNQAKTSIAQGDTKTAIIHLKNAVVADEKNAEARYQLGLLYLETGSAASAEKELRRAREAGYDVDTVNPLLARALINQGEFQRVLDELPIPAGETPDTASMLTMRAIAELALSRKEDARKGLKLALEITPRSPDVHLASAHLALADNDVESARRAIDQALQIDPKNRDGWLLKGELLRASGQVPQAAEAYRTALKIDPENSNARLSLASIAITENRLSEARTEVGRVLKASPNNLQARYSQALIDFRERKIEQAREHLSGVLKSSPEFIPALLLGGAIELALNNLQTAESYLNKVVKAAPKNLYALRLLAATQLRLGRLDDATRTLAPALNQSANADSGLLVVAGEIAMAKRDFAEAVRYFELASQRHPDNAAIRTELGLARLARGDSRAMADLQAAASMDDDSSRANILIIQSQLSNKQFDAALESVAALEKKQPPSAMSWNYRGAAYMGKTDTARARESFSQALKLDPAFFPAAANLARLDLQAKQPVAARQRFESLLKADPKHLAAMMALADLALQSRDEKGYVNWLEKAATAHPQALQPRIALARHLLVKGDKNKALAVAREAANAQPDNAAALDLLGTTQLALGDTANAIASFGKLAERQPDLAAPRLKLAAAQASAKDRAAARKSLQQALALQPAMLDAQLMLASLDIQESRFDEAQKIATQIQQQSPASAAGYALAGDIALARQDYAAALGAFEQAQKRAPSGTLLIRQLQALTLMQRAAEGEARLQAWLATHPQDTQTRVALAESLLKRGQHKAAVEQYLALNRSTPNNLMILNNLAWALLESGDSRALEFAEQAFKLKPDHPAVMDTLGWVLIHQNQGKRGIQLLQQALSKTPDAPEIQYHLAVAFAKSGDRQRAKSELKRLLASGTPFSQETQARALLAQLQAAP